MANEPFSTAEVIAEELHHLRGTAPAEASREAQPLSALCISGGGIRSATFGLGALQGLAEAGLLDKFDYLSTVSGGGYIGSWLTAWKERRHGIGNVIPQLMPGAAPQPGMDPVGHLREYNNYLSPRVSMGSADTWTLASTVLRNMFLNWLVLLPLLVVALVLPRLFVSLARLGETFQDFYGWPFPPILAYVLPCIGTLLFATAIFNTMRYLPSAGNWSHTEGDFLKFCFLPMIAAAFTYITFDSWFFPDTTISSGGSAGLVKPHLQTAVTWMVVSALVGWLAFVAFGRSGKRLALLRSPISGAIVVLGLMVGSAEYLLSRYVYQSLPWPVYITIATPLLVIAFGITACLFVGFSSSQLNDADREWFSRAGAWMLMFVFGWCAACAVVLMAPKLVVGIDWRWQSVAGAAGTASGWLSALAGFKGRSAAGHAKPGPSPAAIVAKLAAPAFLVSLLVGLTILTDVILWEASAFFPGHGVDAVWHRGVHRPAAWNHHSQILESARWEWVTAFGVVFLAAGWLMARYININKFSLHGMYRNRLIRAYLGASRAHRSCSNLTGFDEDDNLYMNELKPGLKPFHVVNVTLNLVAGGRLAWQQRKAASFTITALHCGSAELGYRPSAQYGGQKGITLGTAITISGAAASPNMGYNSSPVLAFIMTLFNARLGAWLGNPGPAGDRTWRLSGPTSAGGPLIREAFGMTDDTSEYVYLSDGGHFENLGLYEMIRRRCRHVVVLDSGCDPELQFEDLANAVRKIRIDFGVTVDFGDSFEPMKKGQRRCALGVIRYSEKDPALQDGYLVYVKPVILGNEPPDVSSYQAAHREFPHQSTADQWFDESQTESYRMLGLHTLREICDGERETDLSGFIQHIRERYLEKPAARTAAAH